MALYRFNDFTFDSLSGELASNNQQQRLEPSIARLLCFFLDNNNELLSRDRIIAEVWQGRIVSDDTINRAISILRQSLNPQQKTAYIKTVPKRGYKAMFTINEAAQQPLNAPEASPVVKPLTASDTTESNAGTTRHRSQPWFIAAISIAIVAIALLSLMNPDKPLSEPAPPAEPATQTVAVLPFLDVSGNTQKAYIGEGISDTIISALSAQQNLQVIARTSSFSIAQEQSSIAHIAATLGADFILEGSTQLEGDKLKVSARLIDVDTEIAVWASTISRSFSDLLSIQEDISHSVLIAVSGSILGTTETKYQPTFEAYNEMILGRHALNLQSTEAVLEAKVHFEKAIELDSGYALAYIMLANSLMELNRINPQTQEYNAQRYSSEAIHQLIDSAITLQPLLSEAHSLKGKLYMQSRQYELARLSLDRATAINPNNAMALADLAVLNIRQNKINQAVITAREALLLNPQDNKLHQLLANALWHNGRAEEAIAVIRDNIAINPRAANNYSLLSRWTLQMGNAFDAMKYAVKEWQLDPDNPSRHWAVCLMHIQVWDEQKAEACIAALLSIHPDFYEAKQYRFILHGDHDGAIELISKQVEAYPNALYYKLQLASRLVINQQWQEAIPILSDLYPNLLTQNPTITASNIWGATSFADALKSTGEVVQAERILHAVLDFVDKSRKLQDGGYTSGIDDVLALALLGNMQEALDRLESAIDEGWLFYSYVYFKMPVQPLAENQRFQQLKQRLENKAEKFQQQIANQLGSEIGFANKNG